MSRLLFVLCLLLVSACESAPEDGAAANGNTPTAAPLDTLFSNYRPEILAPMPFDDVAAARWVDSLMGAMTLEDKIGQLFIVNLRNPLGGNATPAMRRAVEEYGVSGFLMPRLLPPEDMATLTRALQEIATIPLFISADYERGVGRFSNAMTELPSNMAIGATRDETYAAAAGRLTAMESHAIGVNLLFAPVVDVNNNPANPIINIRSYGADPELVGRMGEAFVQAAQAQGVLTTLKHFPGHGNVAVDTHAEMAAVRGTRAALDSIELKPYRMILGGEDAPAAVMIAHLWAQAIEPEPLPATFSETIMRELLREEMGFDGLVVTDDIKMGALQNDYSFTERMVRPLASGADIVLSPDDIARAIAAVNAALEDGRLSQDGIDASVRRILEAKARAGLHRRRSPQLSITEYFLEEKRGQKIANAIAYASITLLKTHETLPLRPDSQASALVMLSNYRNSESIGAAMDRLEAEIATPAHLARNDGDLTAAQRREILRRTANADGVLLGLFLRLRAGRGEAGLFAGQSQLVEALVARDDVPVVLVTFGNPYAVSTFPEADVLLVAYDQTIASTLAVSDVLLGRQPPRGELPITVEPYDFGSGL